MAKKNDGKAAKRAAKKHAKEVKRKRALAARVPSVLTPRSPDEGWRPAREGIEGLAERMGISVHSAAGLAEHLAAHHGRRDAAATWLPSKLRAMDIPAIVAALAVRGIVTDEASFRALAADHLSARRLAAVEWQPDLAGGHDVHDRDFCGEAAERLWREWAVEVCSDEQAEAGLDAVEVAVEEEDPEGAAQRLLRVWEGFEPAEAARRLERAGLLTRFIDLTEAILREDSPEGDLELATRESVANALRSVRTALVLDPPLDYLIGSMVDDCDWWLGRGDDVIARLLDAAAATGNPLSALDAAGLVLSRNDASIAQLQRVRDALLATLPAAHGGFIEDIEGALADIDDVLAIVATS